ncbi:MAG: hypothetical protein GY913_14605 [Proteobacteria bacterium]|nr:hypothetical protein [Pseudomonadota bacterium]MCP4918141.1 hypothetical protein [Pseudomonadota bacterium]
MPKPIALIPIPPPPNEQCVQRDARFAGEGEKRTRYSLPENLTSTSPVGYRTRVSFTQAEANEVAPLLAMERPRAFVEGPVLTEQELFEESSLGVGLARQSTNFRGHRQVTLGPQHSERLATLLAAMTGVEAPVLQGAAYTHICLSRPYRTPFTMLLTFVGHAPVVSLFQVPWRALRKRFLHADDIPTIGYLQHLHLGIWADGLERAVVIASEGRRRAQVFQAPFCSEHRPANAQAIAELEHLAGITVADRALGWTVHMVAQVGYAAEPVRLSRRTARKLGANLLALRSERIQPGVNAEEKAPPQYQTRQDMDVPDELAFHAGRAGYNAFEHWTGLERDHAKRVMLLERVDVLTPGGKERLRAIRRELAEITDKVVANIPLWADLPLMKALSKNAARGKKAFALAGQRIYIGGLAPSELGDVPWDLGVRAFGAAAARSALVCELAGCIDLPPDCDLLAGICLMAGPVNQNDVGKSFYGFPDLLAGAHPGRDATSLLLWTLKAKTVADPVGNEQQLMDASRKGALVDLRCGPHEVVAVRSDDQLTPLRDRDGRRNGERAYADVGNFITDPDGRGIPGNAGSAWPRAWAEEPLWP